MAKINFPDPTTTNPWTDPNGNTWDHDGQGWLARNPTSGGGSLPPGGAKDAVLTKLSGTDGDAGWVNFNPGQF